MFLLDELRKKNLYSKAPDPIQALAVITLSNVVDDDDDMIKNELINNDTHFIILIPSLCFPVKVFFITS